MTERVANSAARVHARRRPCYLPGDGAGVLSVLHLPDAQHRSSVGAVLCAPFGWDALCAHRSLRVWADTLAGAGYPALRFDFPGTGDSSGSPRDPNWLSTATGAVNTAATGLRAMAGCDRIVAIGIGLGGMIACSALDGDAIDDLVLWSVPARGRQLLRELRAFEQMHSAEPVRPRAAEPPRPHEDSVDGHGEMYAFGFLLSAETVAALESLDIARLQVTDAPSRRVLLLGVDGAQPDHRLREHLERSGAAVTVSDGQGYGAMMVDPQLARAPEETFETTLAWLEKTGSGCRSGGGHTASPDTAPPNLPFRSMATLELMVGDVAIRETPFELDYEGRLLSGILAEPAAADADLRLCAVLTNAGGVRRIGNHRVWVDVGRRWAARGVPTLRMDVLGVGDSDGEEGLYHEPDALQRREFAGQLLAAMDELERRGLPPRFIVGGLCSAAYWGLHAALNDERVRGLLLLNLLAFSWSEDLGAARDARRTRALLSRRQWTEILQAAANNGWRINRIATKLVRGLWPSARRAETQRRATVEAAQALTQLNDRGVQILLALSHGEPLYDDLVADNLLDRLGEWPNLKLDHVPTDDHVFRSPWAQRHIDDALDGLLSRTLAHEARRRTDCEDQPPASAAGPDNVRAADSS